MKKIKIAIIGAGVMATKYLEVLSSNKTVSLEGIFSRTFSKAEILKNKFNIKNNSVSINNLYKDTKADIVIVTVPGDHMVKSCIELLNFSWKIFIEKPPGLNFKEFKYLLNISKNKKKKIYVGMNRRYFSSTLNLLKKVESDKGFRSIQIFDQQDTKIEKKKGRSKKIIKYWMYANSIHLIDYISILARGNPIKINVIYKDDKEVNCFIKFSSKDIVSYVCRWNKPGPWQVKISTNNSYYELNPLEVLKIRSKESKEYLSFDISKDDKKYKTGIKLQVDDLINVFLKKKNKLPHLQKMYKTMSLINKIYSI
tara:strand:+ start:2692 stop:3624 length:933 start_codon:yes stop_codon:yes gene_type:complete